MVEEDKILNGVKSNYILKKILDNIRQIKILNIIRYNKTIQNRLNIDINTYKNEYSKIKLELEIFPPPKNLSLVDEVPIQNEFEENTYDFIRIKSILKSFFHIYFDNNNDNEIEVNYIKESDKVSKIKVIIDSEVDSLDTLFYDCSIIKKINFIRLARNDIKNISYLFKNCYKLKEIIFNKFNSENVINMKDMFYNCASLIELNLILILKM